MEPSVSPTLNSSSSSNLFDELPKEKSWGVTELYQWEGFWYALPHLKAAITARSQFEASDDDILLASSMKTGTTWLKALIPSIMHCNGEEDSDDDDDSNDPLLRNHPNALMPSIVQIFQENPNPYLSGMCSPRLFRAHLPYAMLPESVKTSGCKIVYITRNPKDTFVSLWHFSNAARTPEKGPSPLNKAFESFCKGVHPFGPFHDHVLEYWKESVKKSEKILFLKYEDLKRDTRGQLKKLASFLGRPFVKESELDKVIRRCSLERLKNLEVNKNGVDNLLGIANSLYFRRGTVGDWKNSLSTEMKERLDNITKMKLEGSGLDLETS
ncbi:Sulfotransferase [Melia azedarach]|uniref:Sulfotransferase n=1 Tax=Melia azedarach TaxID=155640 RepID=A0ACC1XAE2_MELAZ|nr:Sulfotransferase [Melia azedarach]